MSIQWISSLTSVHTSLHYCRPDNFTIVNIPPWTPSRVTVGDVGYLEKASGRFIHLFSAFDPTTSSQGRLNIPGLSNLGEISIVNQKDRHESVMKRGMKAIASAMPFKGGNPPWAFSYCLSHALNSSIEVKLSNVPWHSPWLEGEWHICTPRKRAITTSKALLFLKNG